MRALSLAVPLVLAACSESAEDLPPEGDTAPSARAPAEGSPEALGILAMLNEGSTTLALLDDDVGLDRRAASNLIDRRDGPDGRFNTLDDWPFYAIREVDEVAFVGDSAFAKLIAYAVAEGFVRDGEADLYGVIESVPFSNAEAAAVVAVCNEASEAVLDDEVGLDRRAASGIVTQRPFATVEEVAEVPYVGSAALERLLAYAEDSGLTERPVLGQEAADLLYALSQDVKGVWWACDYDTPMVPFAVPGLTAASITEANGKQLLTHVAQHDDWASDVPLDERIVDQRTVDALMAHLIVPEPWWQDEERARAARFQPLYDTFTETLSDGRVIEIGEDGGGGFIYGQIDLFFLGTTSEGDLVGLYTGCFSS